MGRDMRRRRLLNWLGGLGLAAVLLGLGVGGFVWWKFFERGPEPVWADDRARFQHGSIGSELLAGIPYPIFWVLPRVFPDLIEKHATAGYGPDKAGHGGYGAFGLAWEPGGVLPVGLALERRGFDRVTMNCALCHTTRYRLAADETARFAVGGPSHTLDLQALLRFLFEASHDRRFTAARMMPEIALQFRLDWIDWALYAAVLIPKTRTALRFAEREMGWMAAKPAWGPGRDDAFNLPKFLLTRADWDDSVGNTDFPALWRLGERAGGLFHAAGEADSLEAVVATSAFGIASPPGRDFRARNRWLAAYTASLEPPAFPLPIDAALAGAGAGLFGEHCATCHAVGGARTGTAIPIDEVGTDGERLLSWTDHDARRMNRITGVLRVGAEMNGAQGGYVAKPLAGLWLLGPYLHNGSVPTLRDLLAPPAERSVVFFRGHDVIDGDDIGFVSSGPEAERFGFRFDTREKGNGNGGHTYGTHLTEPEKDALIAYLKTL
ncbi:mono/diheme cytochrome c family protein [Constrictibacter sp. MBR-5]|jgi:mono/diheme cytochrome c family protein